MEVLGHLIKRAYTLRHLPERIKERRRDIYQTQLRQLNRLLSKAAMTAIGEDFHFDKILEAEDAVKAFRQQVPIFDYQKIYRQYWYRLMHGEHYVTWPGRVKYFALSSGTSEASSKYIPVTKNMLKSIKRSSVNQLVSMVNYDFPLDFYQKGMLMIGGSTHLNYNGKYYEGDLSGITAKNIPFWFQHFYKPGRHISKTSDWSEKLEQIVQAAPSWDIGVIVGVPAWVQIILEKIIERYHLNTIHDIWPNLGIYVHSGVSIKPYLKKLNTLFDKDVYFIESYLASEGYIAYKKDPGDSGMQMILDGGIFYEFIPFTADNFDDDGNVKPNAKAYWLGEVQENVEYALLLSTNAGAWRYLIGDTIVFTNKANAEILITGRTKHFLSVCGEHLSLDNLSRAVEEVQQQLDVDICEFTVMAEDYQNLFAHRWFIGADKAVDSGEVKSIIDSTLAKINDDYRVERLEAIKEVFVEVIPCESFYAFMESKGKMGSANKFPRVLKGERRDEWRQFLEKNPPRWR